MVEKTRRELLAEAFDKSVAEETEDEVVVVDSSDGGNDEPVVQPETEQSGTELDSGERKVPERDEKGTFRKKDTKTKEVGKKPAPTEEEKQEAEAARKDAEGKPVQEERQPVVTDKAPNSWKPTSREHWAKIPAEARAEITRREREIQTTLSQTANVRKFANDFANVINPFSHLIRAQNSSPLQAVHNLMSTAAGLMTGNEQQKAAIVAEIIQNYGVDCNELDGILSAIASKNGGKVPDRRQSRREEHVPTWAQPIIAKHKKLEELEAQHEERLRTEADEEISKVESEPYFDDLRDDIADIMEVAANRGRKITVRQAYERAVEFNPDIKKLITQHKVAAKPNGGKQVINRARRAAATIAGAPMTRAGGVKGDEKMSRRQQLAQAWDDAVED